jgi:UDP-4-amino-4,6-dideoxy-N-acetyl-beta-L-altrosamine N-acetyltransferase
MGIELLNFTTLDNQKLMTILEWRNDRRIRLNMKNTKIISSEEHLSFIERLKHDKSNQYYLVLFNKNMIGVIYLNDINNGYASCGLYKNPGLRKVGPLLLEAVVNLGIRYTLNKLSLYVLKRNIPAISLYKKFGFEVVNEDGEFYYMEKYLRVVNTPPYDVLEIISCWRIAA